jgi:hypothetical protein
MQYQKRIPAWILCFVMTPVVLFATLASAAQPQQAKIGGPSHASAPAPTPSEPSPQKDFADIQDQLLKLLRLSPTLTTVVAADPSLLANREYVSRNNPQLAQFLVAHPEIARNPDFYLFSNLNSKGGRRDQALKRAVWPDMALPQQNDIQNTYEAYRYSEAGRMEDITEHILFSIVFLCILVLLIWLIRAFLEHRRWNRIFKLQSEVHGKLIDKFGSGQELAAYMETEAGKRFLEAAPISVGFEPQQRVPNAVARVLTPLQIGIVLILLGMGCYLLRYVSSDLKTPMLVFGTLALMPGLGFIISAGITWVLAGRLGLMPEKPKGAGGSREEL